MPYPRPHKNQGLDLHQALPTAGNLDQRTIIPAIRDPSDPQETADVDQKRAVDP